MNRGKKRATIKHKNESKHLNLERMKSAQTSTAISINCIVHNPWQNQTIKMQLNNTHLVRAENTNRQ